MAGTDDLDQLRQATAKLRAGAQSGTAMMEPDDEEVPAPHNDLDKLRTATASLRASTVNANHVPGSENIIPFRAAIPRTPPSIVQRPINLGIPDQGFDTTQIPRNVFTGGAQGPGMATEEEKARWRASLSDEERQRLEEFEARQAAEGTPDYEREITREGVSHLVRNIRDIAGDVSGYGPPADPSQSLTDVTGFVPPEKRRERPFATAVTQAITGLGTPENASLLLATVGMGSLPALAKAGISTYFAAQMAQGAFDQIPGIQDARARGDWSEVKRLATLAGINVLMGAAVGAHGIREAGLGPEVKPSPFAEKEAISGPLARDEAAAVSKAPVVGAGEATTPELPATLKAQVDKLGDGTNPVVYFPKGTETIPAPPEDANVTIVKGNRPGAGTYYHDDSITPADIRKAVKNGTYGELLGNVQTKEEAAQGQPAAVVARNEKGIEQKAAVVDTGKSEAVQAQAQKLADQFPGANIGVETPEKVIAGRQAPTTKPETSVPETPLSAQTQQVKAQPQASRTTEQVEPPKYEPLDVAQPTAGKTFYHGTRNPEFTEISQADPLNNDSGKNLFGPGFYMTDSRKIAGGYGKRGAVLEGKLGNLKLDDLSGPASPQLIEAMKRSLPADDFADITEGAGKNPTGEKLYNEMRDHVSHEYGMADYQEISQNVAHEMLQQGIDGFRYEGGGRAKADTAKHNALVLFPDTIHGASLGKKVAFTGQGTEEVNAAAQKDLDTQAAAMENKVKVGEGVPLADVAQIQTTADRVESLVGGKHAEENGKPATGTESARAGEKLVAKTAENQHPTDSKDATSAEAVEPAQASPPKIPRTAPGKLEKFAGDPYGQRVAQLYANRLRNPVEREYTMSYLKARLAGKVAPTRTASIDAGRASDLRARVESELQRTAPKALAEKYSPDTLETARQELRQAYELASSFDRPGRYHPDLGPEASIKEQDGAWYGVSSSRKDVAQMFPWYGEIEQGADKLGELIKKGKGAEYERLLGTVAESIQREKDSAAPVIAEFAPRLRELSDRIDGSDQDLSDSLAQLANSDGRGFKNLREYIQGKVQDAERANSFFTAIDNAANEARQASVAETPEHGGELRPGESGRTATGAESQTATFPEGPAPSALPETARTPETSEAFRLKTGKARQQRPIEEQNAFPGMEQAIEEQHAGAARVRGERLGEEANRPLGSIEEAAGEMERESPLFRGTGASPQKEMFAPEVGDHIQVTAGSLKGKTVEVTKIGETGVYAREGEGPIKFVKNGEFEAAPKAKAAKPNLINATAYSNPLFDPELWKSTLGYLKPAEAAGSPELRQKTGELARKQAVLQEKMKAERKRWRGRSDADMMAFADMVENGEADRAKRGVTLDPKTQALLEKGKKSLTDQDKNLAATLRSLLDEGRTSVQDLGTGKLQNFIENYFPHIWEQKGSKIGAAFGQVFGKKPLEGPKSFLKQRTIPTTAEGFDADLKPVTNNPVDLALIKMHEMNRYVMAHQLLDQMKEAGTAEFVGFGQKAPEGWKPLDDKVFQVLQYSEAEKGMVIRGRYYAPPEVAQPINRYVASGLKGIPVYDLMRGFGNSLNQLQLGLSGFHLGTTSLNSVISQFALGAKQAARGELLKAGKNILTAPAAPIRNLIQGGAIAKDYLRPDQAKKYAATADAIEKAGGRVGIGEEYIDNRIERMMESFANKKYFKGALQAIPAAVEAQAIPVLKWTVPRMKLGAFHDIASDIFDRASKKGWDQDKIRGELQKSWDSIDNRFGQVVYDNLNWNKTAKDLAFIGVRSVGWNYGTWRELGGGVKDFAAQAGQALNGKGFDVTDRMAYTFALPVTIATLGGLYMYAHTGKWPQTAKDYFYPKNGKVEEDGTEARASLPSYMKDVFAVSQHPIDTAMHKVNPAVGLITEMLENKDYYGNEIRNADDPAVAQLGQALSHVGKSFLPFTLRNAQKRAQIGQKGIESQVENFLGITPAPRNQERSDAEALAHDLIQRRSPAGAHTTAEQKKQQRVFDLEKQAREGTLTRDALKQKLDSGEVTEQDAITAIKRSRTPGLVRGFIHLTIPEALKVWDVASNEERKELKPFLETKIQNSFPKMTREDMDLYRPLLRRALTGESVGDASIPRNIFRSVPFREVSLQK